VVLGIGFPTLIPTGGVNTMQVADVDAVRIDGLLFDAGTTNSNALLTIGTQGSTVSHASNPISVQDTFFRIGGDIAGQATNSLIVNANNTLIDDIWPWRADHGNSGTVGWTVNTAAHGLVVNGANVLATGLFVEHYSNSRWCGTATAARPSSSRTKCPTTRQTRPPGWTGHPVSPATRPTDGQLLLLQRQPAVVPTTPSRHLTHPACNSTTCSPCPWAGWA